MKKAILLSIFWLSIIFLPSVAEAAPLIISEIMYDVPGSDQGQEWVEVYNNSGASLEIVTGSSGQAWRFFDGANHLISLFQGTTTVAAGEYFIIAADAQNFSTQNPNFNGSVFDTTMSLGNSGDSVAISSDGGKTKTDEVAYLATWGASGNGNTLEKINLISENVSNNWQESVVAGGSPGQVNSIRPIEPALPVLSVTAQCPSNLVVNEVGNFFALVSGQNDSNQLSILWNFGDNTSASTTNAQHAFNSSGEKNIILQVSEGPVIVSDDCQLVVSEEDTPNPTPPAGGADNANNNNWYQIIISEIFPNPVGSDDLEWIELYNRFGQSIDLSGFALQDNSTTVYNLENQSIGGQSYLLIYKSQSKISLNNSGGDSVKLYNPRGDLQEQVSYSGSASEGKSFARIENNFSWNAGPTPGQENIVVANQAPLAKIKMKGSKFIVGEKITFSAEESSDPEEGDLKYSWAFGDDFSGDEKIENHSYENAGTFQVQLTVTDDQGQTNSANQVVNIEGQPTNILLSEIKPINFTLNDLIISEFLPDPDGSDEAEWVELYNNSNQDIDLAGWQLDDDENGSQPFTFSKETIIKSKDYLVVARKDSKIALNNNGDKVRLLTPLKELWQAVSFGKIAQGQSQAWDNSNQEWFVSTQITPGLPNENNELGASSHFSAQLDLSQDNSEIFLTVVALQDVKANSASLFVAPLEGSDVNYEQSLELYFSQKQWPDIKKGDILQVSGTLKKLKSGPRLKINKAEQIILTGAKNEEFFLENLDINSLEESQLGSYLKTSGVIVKKSGKNIYLSSTAEDDPVLRVYLDFDYKDLDLSKGLELIAQGILQASGDSLRLLVRNREDLSLEQKVLGVQEISEELNTSTQAVSINNRSQQNILVLLIVGAGLLIFFAGYYIYNYYRGKKSLTF